MYHGESKTTKSERDTYQLAMDRKMRAIRPPWRYTVADLVAYALTATHEINNKELRTYEEAITSKYKL